MKTPKPYGWYMILHLYDGTEREYHRVAPSEEAARRMGMMQRQVSSVTNLCPLTREQYERAYGRRVWR